MVSLLKTISLKIGYKSHVLFEDLNLDLQQGKLVCFMGPNGIGKSSLIRTLAGIQQPLAGAVNCPKKTNKNKATDLAVVLTDKISAGSMTVRELVAFGRYPYLDWRVRLSPTDLAFVENAINFFHLNSFADKPIYELSDGQFQMAMIAKAFAQDTAIILLDEPTAHLDLNNRIEIMKLLLSLTRNSKRAILVATHELDLALQIADEIWLAGNNKNILKGIPEDLVLNGSFDEIFQFKGFDLKTGKVSHEVSRKKKAYLSGSGSFLLWTKNAIERNGFEVIVKEKVENGSKDICIEIESEETRPRWNLKYNNRQYKLSTIAALIEHLLSIDCEVPA